MRGTVIHRQQELLLALTLDSTQLPQPTLPLWDLVLVKVLQEQNLQVTITLHLVIRQV